MKKRQINKRGPLDKYLGGPTEATDTSQPPKEATPKDDATWWLTVYLSERSQSRDDIIPDYLEDELSQAIALKVAYEETYWRMFRKELPHLINLDPRQVLFDEIRHIVKEYNELAGRLDPTSTSYTPVAKNREILRSELRMLEDYLTAILQAFGIPFVKKIDCEDIMNDVSSIYAVCISARPSSKYIYLNEDKIRHVLNRNIVVIPGAVGMVGVVRRSVAPRDRLNSIVGVDSTFREISIPVGKIRWDYYAFFATRVRISYDGNSKRRPHITIYPIPDAVKEYTKGGGMPPYLLSTEQLSLFDDYYQRRIIEASLNAIEYDAVEYFASRRGEKFVSSNVYLDGRVLPYEHKFHDMTALHGRFVLHAISRFVALLESLKDGKTGVIGIVKRRGISTIWSVLRYAFLLRIGEQSNTSDTILRDPDIALIRDGVLALLMFQEAVSRYETDQSVSLSDDDVLITYIVVRPLWALDEFYYRLLDSYAHDKKMTWQEIYENEHKVKFWEDVLRYLFHSTEFKEEALRLLDNYESSQDTLEAKTEELIAVLARALSSRAALFYIIPYGVLKLYLDKLGDVIKAIESGLYVGVIPELARWEVLIPGMYVEEDMKYHDYVLKYVEKAFRFPETKEELYVPYQHIARYPENLYVMPLLPVPVRLAHEIVTQQAEEIKKPLMYFLTKMYGDAFRKSQEIYEIYKKEISMYKDEEYRNLAKTLIKLAKNLKDKTVR